MKNRFVTAADGSVVYVTIDGDVVDLIAHTHYGKHEGTTELVLNANPGLASRGPILPAGLAIKLPRVSTKEQPRPLRKLWD